MKTSELKAKAARYMKIVEWSDQDGCFVGSAPPLIGPCCRGKDEAKVYAQLCRIVEEWVEILEKDGRELPESLVANKFSGKFVLRVEPALHDQTLFHDPILHGPPSRVQPKMKLF